MSDNRIQEYMIINKKDVDIIGNALEEYWGHEYHHDYTINEINDARTRLKKIKEKMEKLNDIKICWN